MHFLRCEGLYGPGNAAPGNPGGPGGPGGPGYPSGPWGPAIESPFGPCIKQSFFVV